MTRIEELTLKLADGRLSDAEDEELGKLIREDPDALRMHLSLLELEADLRARNPAPSLSEEILEKVQNQVFERIENQVMDRIEERKTPAGSPALQVHPDPAPKRAGNRSATRRDARRENPWRMSALGAAGILAVLALFWALGPSEPDPAAPKKAKARVARDLEQDAQKKRLEAEAHLREIEGRRLALTQATPEPAESAAAKDKRAKELLELKKDQERIEQELREAVLAARKAARPDAEAGPRDAEKPSAPPALPPAPSGGATRAIAAKVEEVSGEAFLVAKEGKSPLVSGMILPSAQGLETGGGASRLALSFPDSTRVEFGPDTTISELRVDQGKKLYVRKGSVRAAVSKQAKGEPLIFTTPHGEAKVLGTMLRLHVDADPKKGTCLEVEEGKVELRNPADKSVLVESGQYAVSAAGAALIARPMEPPRAIDDMEGSLAWRQYPETSALGISLIRDRVHGGRAALRVAYRPQSGDAGTWGTMSHPLRLRPEDRTLRFYLLVDDHVPGSNWTVQFRQRDTTCWMIGLGECDDLRPGWNRIELDLPREPKLVSDPVGPFDPSTVETLLFSVCRKPAVLLLDDFAVISAPDSAGSSPKRR